MEKERHSILRYQRRRDDVTRILVVDDEEDVLTLARVLLEAEGYVVETAVDAEEAQRMISEDAPDLVLLDVVLPGMSGLDMCRMLKRSSTTSGVKVILFTALGPEVTMLFEERDMPDDVILKPFSGKELVEKVIAQLGEW